MRKAYILHTQIPGGDQTRMQAQQVNPHMNFGTYINKKGKTEDWQKLKEKKKKKKNWIQEILEGVPNSCGMFPLNCELSDFSTAPQHLTTIDEF